IAKNLRDRGSQPIGINSPVVQRLVVHSISIPTLGQWGLILLSLMLVALGAGQYRRGNIKGGDAGTEAEGTYCHDSDYPLTERGELQEIDVPTVAKCMTCHVKDTAKRGDIFDPEAGPEVDVHIAAGMLCQDCHECRADAESVPQCHAGYSRYELQYQPFRAA
ncbi:MAG: IPTL-CTERM sorting domain-containing protein, partial [Xanthomonadales bacterium]|nr:IPTL-CTERM sorting domain-containing protein [Xanthomonadales bacterium]